MQKDRHLMEPWKINNQSLWFKTFKGSDQFSLGGPRVKVERKNAVKLLPREMIPSFAVIFIPGLMVNLAC